ncbi:beta strand repeat-containing protein [Ramlibacter sp. MAHUQ-53]|uniref:beta strand repeat-containing protein n=1 Tax=unclassified Ramlibacter TaxID=2617605 RepID=UPI00362FEA3E
MDNITGTAGNDTVDGVVGNVIQNGVLVSAATLSGVDTINGGAGSNNVLNIVDQVGGTSVSNINTTNIQTVNVSSVGDVDLDTTSGFSGLKTLNINRGDDIYAIAAATTNVKVSGATGGYVDVRGGADIAVTSSQANQDVYVGYDTGASGAVTVNHANTGSGWIEVDGGTNVTVSAQGATGGRVNIGTYNTVKPTGTISVSTSGAEYKATSNNVNLGAINVTGGTTVTVNQQATSSSAAAATDTSNTVVSQGAVSVTGTSLTTAVYVAQTTAAAAVDAREAVAAKKETQVVNFSGMTTGQTVTIDGLTFTAAKTLTAAEVAAAFANLAKSATQNTTATANGTFTGALSANWTSGAVTSTTVSGTTTYSVTFTAATASNTDQTLTISSVGATAPTQGDNVLGAAEVTARTGVLGVNAGTVTINGAITGTDKLATVSVDGFGASSSIASDALTTVTLARSAEDMSITNAAATSLALNVVALGTKSSAGVINTAQVNAGSTYTAMNVATSGADSYVELTAGGVKTLALSGDKALDLSGSSLGALESVTITGAGGVKANVSAAASLASVDASASTGKNTITLNAVNATYTGGAGVDNVTLSATAPAKAVSLGAGDDSLTLATGTTTSTATLSGGDGTDTLVMAAADAATASATATFATKIDGFEKLSLGTVAAGQNKTVNLANLDGISYVTTAGGAATSQAAPTVTIVTTQGTSTTHETAAVTFPALSAGMSITIAGVTATAINDATSSEVAAAFFGYSPTGSANVSVSGSYTTWAGPSMSGSTVFFDYGANGNVTDLTYTATGLGPGSLTLTNMAANGTLEITAAGTGAVVTLADATGTADILNVIVKNGSGINAGTVDAAGVETIALVVTDSDVVTVTTPDTHTITLKDAALKTVTLSGNANANLNLDANVTALTSVNASALGGKLTFATSASGTSAVTVTGGAGNDVLTANRAGDVLVGGAGNDTLSIRSNGVTVTGGAGADVFNVDFAVNNVNAYGTITDLQAGDTIKFNAGANAFKSAKVTLGTTAVFADYANAAIANTTDGGLAWFQFGGDTYVVQNIAAGSATEFTANLDIIVKVTGLVDLSTASFNATSDTLLAV